jgi:hypothetical protein
MDEVVKHGKGLFAIAIAALGVENLICARVSQVVFTNNPPAVPILPFVPPIPFLVYLVGIALLAAGVCMAANIRPCFAAILLGCFFLLWVLVLLGPKAVARPHDLNIRTWVFEVLARASAFTLAGGLGEDVDSSTVRRLFVGKLIASVTFSRFHQLFSALRIFLFSNSLPASYRLGFLAACSGRISRARGSLPLVSASGLDSWRGGGFLAGNHVPALVLASPCSQSGGSSALRPSGPVRLSL